MVNARDVLERRVNLGEVVERVVYAYNAVDAGHLGLLNHAQLFNRVIVNQPDVSMSIKKLHGLCPKKTVVSKSRPCGETYILYL